MLNIVRRVNQRREKKIQANKLKLLKIIWARKDNGRTQVMRTEIIFYLKKIFRKLVCWAYTLIYCKEGGMRSIWSLGKPEEKWMKDSPVEFQK